jgi:hypothetical protein
MKIQIILGSWEKQNKWYLENRNSSDKRVKIFIEIIIHQKIILSSYFIVFGIYIVNFIIFYLHFLMNDKIMIFNICSLDSKIKEVQISIKHSRMIFNLDEKHWD